MTDTIVYHRSGTIGYLTLNHPDRHNSLGQVQLDAIEQQLSALECDESIRVLVLTGAGEKTFCAGASLSELGSGVLADATFQRMTAQLASMRIPTICALNGNVFGGGAELAASCDFRIGVSGMRMRVPAASLGLCYPLEGIRRFVDSFGVRVTRRILVASEEFDTQGLLEIGFLDRVVEPEKLGSCTQEFAEHIAALAPLAVQSMNQILSQMAAGPLDVEAAEKLVDNCLHSRDLQEGLAAQREKRKPEFDGR